MRIFKKLFLAFLLVFITPALCSAAWWSMKERPKAWNLANWHSANVLPSPQADKDAHIYIFAARTGGMKGAVSMHSWIVTKLKNDDHYNRYDKVGWGLPVRKNAYDADGYWYSNEPQIISHIQGSQAQMLIPKIETAIKAYPYNKRGDYKIWPGPNSNTFVAFVLRQVPELNTVLPANGVGRDFTSQWVMVDVEPGGPNIHAQFGGYLGFAAGLDYGFELQILGLVAGVDFKSPALKIPGYGRLEFNSHSKSQQ